MTKCEVVNGYFNQSAMMTSPDFYEMENTRRTKNSLGNFHMDSVDPRNISADALSAIVDMELDGEPGGVRENPTCEELAMEGENLTKQGEYKEAIPLLETALGMETDDSQLHSVLWSLLGNAHFYLGDYEKAVICHSHDLAICCGLQDEKSRAQAYCNLGIAHRKQGYLERAKMCYESYLEICEQLEDCKSISKANYNIGDLHLTLGRLMLQKHHGRIEEAPDAREHFQMSAMYFEKHLEYIKESGSKGAEARAHACLGLVYELMKDTDRAIDHHQIRLKLSQEIKDKPNEGRAYSSIGNCLRAIIQHDKSIECYKRGLGIATELNDSYGIGVCNCNLGTTIEALGNTTQAIQHHQKHLECMQKVQNLEGQLDALSNLAKAYQSMANITKACDSLDRIAEIHKKLNHTDELNETLSRLTQLGGTPGCSGASSTTGTSNSPASTTTGAGNAGDESSSNKKSGGLFKKLKEKRAKKRSIVGQESSADGVWRTGSPIGEERKSIINRKYVPKTTTENKTKETTKEAMETIEQQPLNVKSPNSVDSSRRRSWSHGNINKISHTDNFDFTALPNNTTDQTVPHSSSISFSSQGGGTTQTSQEDSVSSDKYVIHGPSPGDHNPKTAERVMEGIYVMFGDEVHKQTLKDLREYLDSSGESQPLDLSIIQDWNGWVIGTSDIVIQTTKESKLI